MAAPKTLWSLDRDGRLRLSLHPGQTRAWQSQRRFVFVLAGTQGGKTSFGPWWLWREIRRCGAGDYLAVTASYDLFKLKLLPEIRTVFEQVLGIGRFWSGERVLEIAHPQRGFLAKRADDPMYARIILRSAASPGGLESSTAKAAWGDEIGQDGVPLDVWEAIQRRLSLHEGRFLGTTTIYNIGWLKNEVYDPWLNGDATLDVIQFSSLVNPAFPKAEFERVRLKLQTWRFLMFYEGKFSRPAGLIYGDFEDRMLVDPFAIPDEWPRVVGLDFGGANTATIWLALDPRMWMWYAYHETLDGGKSTPEHVKTATTTLGSCNEFVFVGGALSETQERMDWKTAGLPVLEPLVSGVEAGISRVTALIKSDKFRVFRTCKGLRDELGSYRRKLDDAGEVTEEILDKRKFHRLDGMRYAATAIMDDLPEDKVVYNSDIRVHVGY